MKTLKKVLFIIGKENKKDLFFLLSINIVVFFLEFFSMMSIPIFASALLNTKLFISKYDFLMNTFIEENFLVLASIFLISTFLLKNLSIVFGRYVTQNYLKNLKIKLSTKLFSHYFQSSLLDIQFLKPSIMFRNCVSEVEGVYAYLLSLNKLILETSAAIVIFIILLTLNVQMSLTLILIFSSVTFFYFKFVRPTLKRKAKENQIFLANFNKSISETFEAIKDIKIFQKERDVYNLFKKDIISFEKNMFFFKIFEIFPRILLEIISIIVVLVVSLIIFTKSNSSNDFIDYIPALVLVIGSSIRLIPAFSGINLSLFYLRVYARSIDIISEQLKRVASNHLSENKKKNINPIIYKKDLDLEKNYLIVDNVSFSYDKNQKLLKNINLKIPKKSSVAIVGQTGSGKSTLQHIMMGLIQPDEGNVFFKNRNLDSIYNSWISKIAYVSQKVFILDDTIEKNICLNFDNSKIDQTRLEAAIQIAELKNKISSFDNKIKEQTGTDGINLSGGERQRIAIARAFYKKSEILFLDEFTSSLDNLTQQKIIDNLKVNLPETTIIMISHRQEITEKCDFVIKLGE